MREDAAAAQRRPDGLTDCRRRFLKFVIGVKFVTQTALQPSAASGNFRGIERRLLEFRHLHGDGRHRRKKRIAAYFAPAVADVGEEFGFVAHADLLHFDSRLKFCGERAYKFAEIDAAVGDVIDDDAFAAEYLLHAHKRQFDAHAFDDLETAIEIILFFRFNRGDPFFVFPGRSSNKGKRVADKIGYFGDLFPVRFG